MYFCFTAPQRKADTSKVAPWHGPQYNEPVNRRSRYYNVSLINKRPIESEVSRHAPYQGKGIYQDLKLNSENLK